MRVWIMERSRYGEEGMVMICANTTEEALKVYHEYENYNDGDVLRKPHSMVEMPSLSCISFSAKVIYSIAR